MKLFQFVLCALTYQASYQAAVKERILYGNVAREGQFPYQVQVMFQTQKRDSIFSNESYGCGGSLISDRHVLTATHCFFRDGFPVKVAIAFGSEDSKNLELQAALLLDDSKQILDDLTSALGLLKPALDRLQSVLESLKPEDIQVCCDCWVLHELNDIAIIILPETVQFSKTIQPVKLPSRADEESELCGKTALATGWGTTERDEPSNTLLYANFTIANNSICKSQYDVPEGYLCAMRNSYNEPTICHGDSGGPLVVDNKQVGIASSVGKQEHEPDTCHTAVASAYTSVIYHLEWISNATGIKIDECEKSD